MQLSREEVEKIADLARLKISHEEADKLAGQLSNILTLMEALNRLDTEGIEPTSHAQDEGTPLREDVVVKNTVRDAILDQAPEREDTLFKVPKVIQS